MPKVALIQDGTEVARQWVGDVKASFEACLTGISDGRFSQFSPHVFTDEEVGSLLDGVAEREWSCLVFASNALLSGPVIEAMGRHRQELLRYVESGGGLVVLHQLRDSLSPVLPGALEASLVDRSSQRGSASAHAPDDQDVLLHYPASVPWNTLRDFGDIEFAQLRADGDLDEVASLFFKVLELDSLPEKLKPVLTGHRGEVLLARSDDSCRERVLVTTIPLDWYARRHGQEEATTRLLSNAIHWASLGTPRRLVWYGASGTLDELLLRWLTLDGAAAIHAAPERGHDVSATDRWLLSRVDAFVVPHESLEWLEERDEATAFLARGGVLASSVAESGHPASRVTALVGRYEERMLASRLYAELRAVDGWRSIDYAFELRNIVAALFFLNQIGVAADHAEAVELRFDDLKRSIYKRLGSEKHREDIGSSVALVQTLAHLEHPKPLRAQVAAWMRPESGRRAFDVALPIRAVVAYGEHTQDATFLGDAASALEQHLPSAGSLAPFVRVLDAITLLAQVGLLASDPATATRLAQLSCDALDRFPAMADQGWLSVEATADVTRGLVTLYGLLPADVSPSLLEHLVGHVATGATALRRALPRYRRNPQGVAWLARVVQALVVADRTFPLGLQRLASLEWPELEPERSEVDGVPSLVEHLAIENKRLREREAHLAEQQLAARVGRGAATVVPVAILVAGAVLATLAIGWSTVSALSANIGILVPVLLGLLGSIFAVLARLHLLAKPAATVRDLVAGVFPRFADLLKLKRG